MLCFLILILCSSCATILHGYYKNAEIINAPKDLTIQTKDGVNILWNKEIKKSRIPFTSEYKTIDVVKIKLRSKKEHILVLEYNNNQEIIEMHGKIDLFMLFLDTITGVFPAFIDAYTGNWYMYNELDLSYLK